MPALSEAADGDLLALAGGEPEAFGELFKRHSRAVYAYCARRTGNLDLAEDLTSVVFMEAFRRRRKLQLSNTSALPMADRRSATTSFETPIARSDVIDRRSIALRSRRTA